MSSAISCVVMLATLLALRPSLLPSVGADIVSPTDTSFKASSTYVYNVGAQGAACADILPLI